MYRPKETGKHKMPDIKVVNASKLSVKVRYIFWGTRYKFEIQNFHGVKPGKCSKGKCNERDLPYHVRCKNRILRYLGGITDLPVRF